MTSQIVSHASNHEKPIKSNDDIEDCALRIVKHLERHIIRHRNNSLQANRLACMNKYIQVTYLSERKSTFSFVA